MASAHSKAIGIEAVTHGLRVAMEPAKAFHFGNTEPGSVRQHRCKIKMARGMN